MSDNEIAPAIRSLLEANNYCYDRHGPTQCPDCDRRGAEITRLLDRQKKTSYRCVLHIISTGIRDSEMRSRT